MNRRYALKQILAGGSSLILLNETLVSRVLKGGGIASTLTINIDSSRFDDLTNVNGTVEITDAIAPGIQAGLLGNFPLALVRVDQSTISALEKYCMHQGCEVGSYNGTRFECPCHGSRYSSTGAVLRGPTTAPLKSYTTSLNGSILTVSGLPGNTSWNLTSADDVTGPTAFELKQNYPNPFGSPSAAVTEITYVLGTATQVHLSVYDTSGRNVATLVDSKQGGGVHTVRFDASHLAAGTYFYTLRAGNFIESKRMQLLK